ncbi:putative glycolipid-binding domain-containing protein [Streptomyces sp. NPDC004752]
MDRDLVLCPLTDTMPVPRDGLHRAPGERQFLMAWVSVPDLGARSVRPACPFDLSARSSVRPSRQTFTRLWARPGVRRPVDQRSVTLPPATSRRRVTCTASSIRRSWVTSRSVPR